MRASSPPPLSPGARPRGDVPLLAVVCIDLAPQHRQVAPLDRLLAVDCIDLTEEVGSCTVSVIIICYRPDYYDAVIWLLCVV
jgi:hypothetical protein